MSKFVIATFPTEEQAYEGTRAFRDLQAEGSIVFYGMVVVTKAADGKLAVKETADRGPVGTGVGALAGGLVGLLGGPAGAAGGAAAGTLIGNWSDLFNLGVGSDFLNKAAGQLAPGKTAVIAEIEEDWVIPLDSRMEKIGGTVLRQSRADFEDDQRRQDVNASKAELAALQAEYRQAREEHKAKLRARIDEARARLDAAVARAKARQERLRQETDAKVKILEEQRAKAKADGRARHERRIAELRADYDQRMDKLVQATEHLDAEALAP